MICDRYAASSSKAKLKRLAVRRPGNLLDPDPAPPARHPPRRVEQVHRRASPRQVSPAPHRPPVVAWGLPTALAATGSAPSWANAHRQAAILAEQRRFDGHLRDTEQTTQYSGQAHGVAPPSSVVWHSQGEQEPHAFSTAYRCNTSAGLAADPLPSPPPPGADSAQATHSYPRRATIRW